MSDVCPVCLSPVKSGDAVCPKCNFHLAGATHEFKPVGPGLAGDSVTMRLNSANLRMVRGPQVGATYSLNAPETTIGRNPASDIFLNDMTVSREHATITRGQDALVIADNNSFNGVWVNNRTVMRHALRPGDYIQIGKYDFIYEESPEGEGNVR